MSLRSWHQVVGSFGFLILIAFLGQLLESRSISIFILMIMLFICGMFFGYGILIPVKEDVKK